MKGLDVFRNPVQKYRVVIVLQASQAFWFKWQGSELIDSHVEPLALDALTRTVRCSWVQSGAVDEIDTVELVLDTALEEVNRVQFKTSAPAWLQSINKRRLAACLRSDHQEATVSALPAYMYPEVLSIVHHVLPENFCLWIQQLQSQGVHVSHVATGTEVLCQCTKNHKGPVLIEHGAGNDRRHILVDGTTPIHMSVVESPATQTSGDVDCADQTRYACIDEEIIKGRCSFDIMVPSLSWPSPSSEFSAARLLAALVVGCPVDVTLRSIDSFNRALMVAGAVGSSTENEEEVHRSQPRRSLGEAARHMFSQRWLGGRYLQNSASKWRVHRRRQVGSSVLEPSLTKSRLNSRIAFLQKATLLCAAMAVATAALASVHGFHAARERNRLSSEELSLKGRLVPLRDSLSVLHRSPSFVARSIERIERFSESRATNPGAVLTVIADAMTRSPSLELDSLSWAALNASDSVDAVFTGSRNVSARESLWREGEARPQIHLELSGNVLGTGGLREQQQDLDAFVSYLKSQPGLFDIEVLESPLDAARSSEALADGQSNYRISMTLSSS